MALISTSRKALYALVWDKTLRGAAKELGISDVGLRKVCDNNNIPRPPAGYFLMKEAKRSRAFRALPDPDNDRSIEIQAVTAEKLHYAELAKDLALDLTPVGYIQDKVREMETLLKQHGHVDERGILNQPGHEDHHLVRVSQPQLGRACDLLISCLSAMHHLGYPSEFKEDLARNAYRRRHGDKQHWVEIRNNKSTVKVWVEEFSSRATRPLTAAERAERVKSTPWYRDDYKPNLIPNGKIYLCFGWSDKVRIDQNPDKALVGLEWMLRAVERRRIALEKHQQQRQTQHRKEIRRLVKIKYREVRKEAILREAKSWSEASLVRDYVRAVSTCNPEELGLDPQYMTKWIAFANRFADGLDPLKNGKAMKKQNKPSVEYYRNPYEIGTKPTDPIDEQLSDIDLEETQ